MKGTEDLHDTEITYDSNRDETVTSRSKRSFDSKPHYIETMIVADTSMLQHHGDDLEHYILSIMMIANRVFTHPSLGSAIAISVVKVSFLINFLLLLVQFIEIF